jgi:hypothetical protein
MNQNQVSVFRLNLLRAMYLLIVVGLGIMVWPGVIHHVKPWELKQGVVVCMLAAFSALSVLGLRYPLQMLPLLMWEMVWKVIWLSVVAWPLWSAGTIDEATASTAAECLMVVLIPFVIPWRYVFSHYIQKPADQWRRQAPSTCST